MKPAIELQTVSKEFKTWHERPSSIKTVLSDAVSFRLSMGKRETKVVFSNLSLRINAGDFVGVMGRNGAGKSTLLKLIAGVYHPNSGKVINHGKIAPLLELGAGFVTELTGYENIFLNASILGYGKCQIEAALSDIVEFSELGEALERPVRNYSSGMLVRLGFSIAVHLNAEILLFDEILAVGDVGFQEKCVRKIRELHRAGRTIVLVTHSPEQVEQFCDRCIVFDHAGVLFDGPSKEATPYYRGLFNR